MAGPDRRSKSMLASAGALRWTGRRVWRSFFAVLFVLSLAINYLALTSEPVFDGLSTTWQDWTGAQDTVLQRFEARLASAEAEAEAARAETENLTADLATAAEDLAQLRTDLAEAQDLADQRQTDRFLLRRAERRVADLRAELTALRAEIAAPE